MAAVSLRRGSTTMMRSAGLAARASSMRRKTIGWAIAGLAPAISRQSASAMSS
jgi:hypothetical protein